MFEPYAVLMVYPVPYHVYKAGGRFLIIMELFISADGLLKFEFLSD